MNQLYYKVISIIMLSMFFGCRNNNQITQQNELEYPHILTHEELVSNIEKTYNVTSNLDTTFYLNQDTINLIYSYKCTHDNKIKVATFYLSEGKNEFVTHNFRFELTVSVNNETILAETVGKEFFTEVLTKELLEFGVLKKPKFKIKDDKIHLKSSVSIPLTDIGISVIMEIDDNGEYIFKRG